MIRDNEAIEAFNVLHDYCDERVCNNCMFFDEDKPDGSTCILRNYNLAYLRAEEVHIINYKIRKGTIL